MAKNQVQFQKGYSLFEFMEDYGSEEQCRQAVFAWRFPNGYVCKECGHKGFCVLKTRNLLQCNRCKHQHSLTSGTVFSSTKLPMKTWFMAIHLLSQSKTGLSAMELKRQLGVNYDTAWKIKHKLLQAMRESDDKHPIEGIIQLDDVYWGGESRGGKRGRGAAGKTPFVAAVALNKDGHPVRMKMNVVKGFRSQCIEKWANQHIKAGSIVISDGLPCFNAINNTGSEQLGFIVGGKLELLDHPAFKWVNVMIGNVKNSLRGSCHAVKANHLPRHLAEYCFRFNNRFDLRTMLPKLAKAAVQTPAMPYRLLKLDDVYG